MDKYDFIELKFKEYLENNKLDEAINILEDELNYSFVPEPYFSKWKNEITNLKIKIRIERNENQKKDFLKNLKKNDLLNNALSNNEININFLNTYINKFKTIDEEDQINVFQILFINKNIRQESKFELFVFIMKNSKRKYDYEFYNNNLNKYIKIDPNLLNQQEINNKNNIKLVNNYSKKDITHYNLCMQILNSFYIYFFPFVYNTELNINNNELVKRVYKYVIDSLDNLNPKDTLIEKILNYFK